MSRTQTQIVIRHTRGLGVIGDDGQLEPGECIEVARMLNLSFPACVTKKELLFIWAEAARHEVPELFELLIKKIEEAA